MEPGDQWDQRNRGDQRDETGRSHGMSTGHNVKPREAAGSNEKVRKSTQRKGPPSNGKPREAAESIEQEDRRTDGRTDTGKFQPWEAARSHWTQRKATGSHRKQREASGMGLRDLRGQTKPRNTHLGTHTRGHTNWDKRALTNDMQLRHKVWEVLGSHAKRPETTGSHGKQREATGSKREATGRSGAIETNDLTQQKADQM